MSHVSLRSIRSHFFGGATAHVQGLAVEQRAVAAGMPRPVDMNGTYSVGQMYAMHYALAQPRSPFPVVLWHGGGMTGAQWESTPDGRPGWLWRLLEAGFDVWVCDAPERGRSSWAMFPQVYASAPIFRSHEEAWELFRLGPADMDAEPAGAPRHAARMSAPYADTQFPTEHFERFACQFVPRWLDHADMALAAYDELIAAAGPCILLGHSQGGGHVAHALQRHPGAVQAAIMVEPTGVPDDVQATPAGVPQLVLWGDHLDRNPLWRTYRHAVDSHVDALRQRGAPVTVLDLPAVGVHGNSHACMSDRNSDEVLGQLVAWLYQVLE